MGAHNMSGPHTGGGVALRALLMRIWLAVVGGVVILVVLGFALAPEGGTDDLAWLFTLLPLAPVPAYVMLGRRALQPADAGSLGNQYRVRFFIGVALAETPALLGFVGRFVTGETGPLLLGAAVSLVLLALHAPTAAAVAREDQRLRHAGATVTLSDALGEGPALGHRH